MDAFRINFDDEIAALATKHGKESAIGPALEGELGVRVEVCGAVDTDLFGTFTGEVPRNGTALETARLKARAALVAHGRARFGLSSEGSFGPHPQVPFVAGGVEFVLLMSEEPAFELVGVDVTMETNFSSAVVTSLEGARSFASKARFPSHGLIVIAGRDDARAVAATKGIVDPEHFEHAVTRGLASHGEVRLETDMRAHLNPTRMSSIGRAARALARAAMSRCPTCERPGYVAVERLGGRPCEDCGAPTERVRAEVIACNGCGRREERDLEGASYANAAECPQCNP